MTALTDFAGVALEVQRLIESLDEKQWSSPTLCEEWDVRAVVDHLLDVQRKFRVTMTGETKQITSTLQDNTTVLISAQASFAVLKKWFGLVTRPGPAGPGGRPARFARQEVARLSPRCGRRCRWRLVRCR
ncbi:maleylpyruvate isomerase N-terminal domain-containing protein [Streptomyces sp. NPDC006285]|uniref:maleylpyruvate isomerase N-terminal domain-containing protein n=1 Tax=Streptomyces sp. NPDC006285 TaxID=3364742 RepID=UPI0036C83D81